MTFVLVGLLRWSSCAGPVIAERRKGGTPWHAHHIAERYGLLVIIALGEGVIGTVASLTALVGPEGWAGRSTPRWSPSPASALTFGMWWIYFIVPSGEVLHVHRKRSFGWGYGHIAAVRRRSPRPAPACTSRRTTSRRSQSSALPARCSAWPSRWPSTSSASSRSTRCSADGGPFHLVLLAGTAAVLAAPRGAGRGRGHDGVVPVVLALAPWVTIVGYELRGHEHNARVLERLTAPEPADAA